MLRTDPAVAADDDVSQLQETEKIDVSADPCDVGRLADNPGFLAARFSFLAASIANRTLAQFDLRTRSYSVLELATVGGGMSQRDIGRILCLDKSHIVRLVDEVAGRGLVGRFKDVRDGRVAIVRATAAGREVAERAAAELSGAYSAMLADLTEADRAEALRALRLLALRF
jgi:DNA-binding MarR family transcriptional regulator